MVILKNKILLKTLYLNFFLNFYKFFIFDFFLYSLFNCKIFKNYFFFENIIHFTYFNFIYFYIYYKNFFLFLFKIICLSKIYFLKYRFFLKIGLGFRKKYSKLKNEFFIYIGLRHWIRFPAPLNNFFFNIRKKNLLIFSTTKNELYTYISLLRQIRKESLFKTKGIFFRRVWIRRKMPRGILFARRVKLSRVRLKLSKKQKTI